MPSTYILANVKVTNPTQYEEYRKWSTAAMQACGAEVCVRGGAFDFIVKGMKREILLNAVARAVERRHLALENRRLMVELRARLDHLHAESGLDDDQWQAVLQGFGPQGELERQRLEGLRGAWLQEAGLRARLDELAPADPLLQPLAQAMAQRTEGPRREQIGRAHV